ncbi:hypothetical protein M569_16944, partial [Genlisea aurea]
GRPRKALAQKVPTTSDANIVAGTLGEPSPVAAPASVLQKENRVVMSDPSAKKKRGKKEKEPPQPSIEKELQEMQEKLEKLTLEKEQAEEMLKAKDEELDTKNKEHEKLRNELKKLQKIKEFKPTMNLPVGLSLRDQDLDKKVKKKKSSSMKKPSPPYVLWCKDQWDEVKKANPEADFKEMSSLLSSKWKQVTAEEKKPYEERYQAEKEAYFKVTGNEKREQEAMKLLEEEHKQKTALDLLEQYLRFKQEVEKEPKKTRKEKDPLKPKHPMSAFFIFSNERRAGLLSENKNVTLAAKIAGEEWKNMTEEQRAPYEKVALEKKAQYAKDLELYKQKKEEEGADQKKVEEETMKLQKQEALQLLKKKEKTENLIKKNKEEKRQQKNNKKSSDPNKPKKPATSFLLFSKETRKCLQEERPEINSATLSALISVKWKEMGEDERKIWNGKAAIAMEAYKKEVEEYNKT